MKRIFSFAAAAALVLGAIQAYGQSVIFTFEDNTDDGFGAPFGSGDASATFSIVNIGGSLQMWLPRTGFQVAEQAHGADGSDFYNAMVAAAANPAGYNVSYDYYIDTSTWGAGAGTFFQLGTYINTGNGFYVQDFGTPKEVELSGTDVASGLVFSGHVSVNVAVAYPGLPPAQTFFRLGLIENGNGAAQGAYFDNISVSPIPEPASLALVGLGMAGLIMIRRRHS